LEYTNGKITNLMSTDSSRIDFAAGFFHQGWTTFVQFGIVIVILVINIGPSAFAGVGLMFVVSPIVTKVVRILNKKRSRANVFTDARIRSIQEILSSIRAIKIYTWEMPFLKKVLEIRHKELQLVKVSLLLRNGTNAVSMALPIYASILAFITYSATGHPLQVGNIFSSLTLFNSMRLPLQFLPRVISSTIDAWVAIQRIQGLLLTDELEKPCIDYNHEDAITVDKATFVWEKIEDNVEEHEKSEKGKKGKDKKGEAKGGRGGGKGEWGGGERGTATSDVVEQPKKYNGPQFNSLPDLSFTIARGEFIIIVGEIGSGKSSLLSALVNEMRRSAGSLTIGGSVAYCPQTAWVMNATLRENILFGKEFDAEKYDQIISDCALEADIAMLPSADATEIGERGVTLSGGQKARVNIARAAYSDADIYLLDDPLSAVDAHVGYHLMDQCICRLLAGKTRILVTHQLQVLQRSKADRIFCLEEGRIVESGTYDELISRDGDFSRLLRKYTNDDEDVEEIEEEIAPLPPDKKPEKTGNRLMEKEERVTGSIKWQVYSTYARMGGGLWTIPAILFAVALYNTVNVMTGVWLSAWTDNKYNLSNDIYMLVYACLGFSQAIFIFTYGVALTITGNRATEKMHDQVPLFANHLTSGFKSHYASSNVVLRHDTFRTDHQSLLQGCRYHGQSQFRFLSNVSTEHGHDCSYSLPYRRHLLLVHSGSPTSGPALPVRCQFLSLHR
jgi:ATP-binding cassette, subfamily C (CFTR/MRP), member 1